jgi:hypothetical protein
MEVWLKNDIGAYKEGEGKKASESFFSGDRFARLVKYFDALKARESFKATFDAVRIPLFLCSSVHHQISYSNSPPPAYSAVSYFITY